MEMSRRQDIPNQSVLNRIPVKGNLPAWCVALQVLALAFQHAGSHFCSSGMIPTWVGDILHVAERHARIDHVIGAGNERVPFVVLRHPNRTRAQFIDGVVGLVGLTFKDAGICVVGLLDFAHHNGLELATGVFQVKVCL